VGAWRFSERTEVATLTMVVASSLAIAGAWRFLERTAVVTSMTTVAARKRTWTTERSCSSVRLSVKVLKPRIGTWTNRWIDNAINKEDSYTFINGWGAHGTWGPWNLPSCQAHLAAHQNSCRAALKTCAPFTRHGVSGWPMRTRYPRTPNSMKGFLLIFCFPNSNKPVILCSIWHPWGLVHLHRELVECFYCMWKTVFPSINVLAQHRIAP
jgi:hypothetical protein